DAHDVTLSAVRRLKQTIQDSLEKDNSRRAQAKTAATPRPSAGARGAAAAGADVFGMLDGLVPSTPATGSKLKSGGGSASASGLNSKLETPRSAAGLGSSPAGRGMNGQLKAMNGTP